MRVRRKIEEERRPKGRGNIFSIQRKNRCTRTLEVNKKQKYYCPVCSYNKVFVNRTIEKCCRCGHIIRNF